MFFETPQACCERMFAKNDKCGHHKRGCEGPAPEEDKRKYPAQVSVYRNFCTLIKIDREGTVAVIRPARNWNNDVFQPVFDQFRRRVEIAVKELGPLELTSDSLLFEFSTPDLPHCRGGPWRGAHCEEMWELMPPFGSSKCCGRDGGNAERALPMIGHSRNICCDCSLTLPISKPQMPEPLQEFLMFTDPFRWEEKKPLAVWHGSRTGHAAEIRFYTNYFRHIAKQINGTMASSKLRRSSLEWWPAEFIGLPRDRVVNISLQNREILDATFDKIPWSEMVRYKLIIAISGHTWASLLKPALLSNSCVIKQDPIATEWFETYLVEWIHYVPVLYDLSDLLEKIKWAQDHDEECRKIGENGRKFALRHFTESSVNSFVHKALSNTLHTYGWDE